MVCGVKVEYGMEGPRIVARGEGEPLFFHNMFAFQNHHPCLANVFQPLFRAIVFIPDLEIINYFVTRRIVPRHESSALPEEVEYQ